jgi:site-specific DNA-methyltransferase (adenine-specific)
MNGFEPTLMVGDCREKMREMPEGSIDLICTSPPYNCKIKYDNWDDELQYSEYLKFMREWLIEAYRVLKDDGRIALNLFYEISQPGRGGRVFVASDVWQIMKEIGFQWNGLSDLEEEQSERIKYTAWGSWMSASAPYQYFPGECVMHAYKKTSKKLNKGTSTIGRDEFMSSVKGKWRYRATTSAKTPATFSIELPLRAINLFSYREDVVLDPFCGRGTTGAACKILGRKFIGIDISENYIKIARDEIARMSSNGKKVEKINSFS